MAEMAKSITTKCNEIQTCERFNPLTTDWINMEWERHDMQGKDKSDNISDKMR